MPYRQPPVALQRRFSGLMLLAALLALLAAPQALGQGFMVKPMRLEAQPTPGQRVEVPLQIRNTAADGPRDIVLRLVELSQTPQGSWRMIELDSDEDLSHHASCREWITLSDTAVSIAPLSPGEITVAINAPHDARGSYFAGVIAETPLPEDPSGITVRVRFLIPVVIEIAGRPVRQQVTLDDAQMIFTGGDDGQQPTTNAHLRVTNAGRTFSRFSGAMRIERQSGERWRPVTRVDIPERGIIPGVTLEVGGDLDRRLPSGVYRLHGELSVDGRRLPSILKELEFEGDPTVDVAVYDTALILDPEMIAIEITPGATRTAVLTIENPGDDVVSVELAAATPRPLTGVEMDGLYGVELSAEPWTEINPASFTLRGRGRQNVRIVSRTPREGVDHAHYYADLIVQASYEDGQSAGESRSLVHLTHSGAETRSAGVIEQLSLAETGTAGEYIVQTRFTNVGNVHVTPVARAYVLSPQGQQVRNTALSGDAGLLLPLSKRTLSGELDLNGMEPGYYALRANMDYAGGRRASKQLVLRIEEGPEVTVFDPEDPALPEGVELPADDDALVISEDQAVALDDELGSDAYLIVEDLESNAEQTEGEE